MRMLALAAAVLAVAPAAAAPVPVTGRWWTENRRAIVEIAPCGAAVCGRITRVQAGSERATDTKNPDQALRNRPIQGLTILSGFTASGDAWHGRIYDPQSGRSYRSELRREGGTLKVKGCLGPFCRTQSWSQAR